MEKFFNSEIITGIKLGGGGRGDFEIVKTIFGIDWLMICSKIQLVYLYLVFLFSYNNFISIFNSFKNFLHLYLLIQ